MEQLMTVETLQKYGELYKFCWLPVAASPTHLVHFAVQLEYAFSPHPNSY